MYIQDFAKFIKYYGKERRLKLIAFIVLSLIAGFLEFIGIVLIYPFVIAIINNDLITEKILMLPQTYQSFLLSIPAQKLALLIGFFAMTVFILKNIFMIFFVYVQSRFLQHWNLHINNKIMRFFLYAPYKIIQKIPNAEKIYALTMLSERSTNGFCLRLITLITNTAIVAAILVLILYKFLLAGIASIIFIALSLFIQNKLVKAKINKINSQLATAAKDLNDANYSNINYIKEIKIQNAEDKFYNKYTKVDNKYTKIVSGINYYSGTSPYIVEILIVTALILLGIIISFNTGAKEALIASLALIVAAIFRIAPALNRIQTSLLNLPSTSKFLKELLDFYEKYDMAKYENITKSVTKIGFRENLEFRNVNFSYEENKPILKNISFKINKGDFVGIIGLSGAGKSTLADVMTGLLPIDSGEICIDGNSLNSNTLAGFRENIGYVQQEFDMLEISFRENIAWGEPSDKIDDERVIALLKKVQLWDVVDKYDDKIYAVPFVGESGLSKGQKQRLAIARALYRNPEIFLFDEATSALDVKTEHEITEILKELCTNKTIITIAHRLSTLQACNKLIYIKDGSVVDIGSFKELSDRYPEFAELVKLSSLDNGNQ